MDVIARCAFGMTIENLGAEDDPFMNNAKKAFTAPANKSPLILILCMLIILSWFVPNDEFKRLTNDLI